MNGWDLLQIVLVAIALYGIIKMIGEAKEEKEKDRKKGIEKKFWDY